MERFSDYARHSPVPWLLAVVVGLLIGKVFERRDIRRLEDVGAELGTYYGERDRAAAGREERLFGLTRVLAWLTGAVLVVALGTLGVALDL